MSRARFARTMASFWSTTWTGRAFFLLPSGSHLKRSVNEGGGQHMDQVRTFLVKIGTIALCLVALGLGDRALAAEEQSAGEAAGAGRLSRETQEPPVVICGGCVAPSHASQGKGSITPYGRIELDAIYSTRNTNPLDPGQFNGYATAAGNLPLDIGTESSP